MFKTKSFLILVLAISHTFAQTDSLLKKKYTQTYHTFKVFAVYDAIKYAGLGIAYQPDVVFDVDLSIGAVYLAHIKSPSNIEDKYNKGIGATLNPKFKIGNRRQFYLGLYFSVYNYGFSNQKLHLEEYESWYRYNSNGSFDIQYQYNFEKSKTTFSYALGFSTGFSKSIKHLYLDFFALAGVEKANSVTDWYGGYTYQYSNYDGGTTSSFKNIQTLFNAQIGLKIGLGFKPQQFLSSKYYKALFNEELKLQDNLIEKAFKEKVISEEDYRAYYRQKNKEWRQLKGNYNINESENQNLRQQTELSVQEMKEYGNELLKPNP